MKVVLIAVAESGDACPGCRFLLFRILIFLRRYLTCILIRAFLLRFIQGPWSCRMRRSDPCAAAVCCELNVSCVKALLSTFTMCSALYDTDIPHSNFIGAKCAAIYTCKGLRLVKYLVYAATGYFDPFAAAVCCELDVSCVDALLSPFTKCSTLYYKNHIKVGHPSHPSEVISFLSQLWCVFVCLFVFWFLAVGLLVPGPSCLPKEGGGLLLHSSPTFSHPPTVFVFAFACLSSLGSP